MQLADGRLLCTYGFRDPPFAIRAVVSEDDGASWRTGAPIPIRENLPNKDLGYPFTLPLGAERAADDLLCPGRCRHDRHLEHALASGRGDRLRLEVQAGVEDEAAFALRQRPPRG